MKINPQPNRKKQSNANKRVVKKVVKKRIASPHTIPQQKITTTTNQFDESAMLTTAMRGKMRKIRRKRPLSVDEGSSLFSVAHGINNNIKLTMNNNLLQFIPTRGFATPAGDKHPAFSKRHPAVNDAYYEKQNTPGAGNKKLFGIESTPSTPLIGDGNENDQLSNIDKTTSTISSEAFANTIINPVTLQVGNTKIQTLSSPAMFNIDPTLYQYIDDKSWLTLRKVDNDLPAGLPATAQKKIRDFQAKLPAPVHIDTCSILSLPKDLGGFGFEQLTFIQGKLLPMIASGLDILLRAPTSSGKTLAYAIPLVERLIYQRHAPNSRDIPILVLLPSRELALQTSGTIQHLLSLHQRSHTRGFGVFSLVGGSSSMRVEQEPLMRTDIGFLVCTTQRLIDHIEHTPGFKERLKNTKMVVFDEVDYLMGQTGGSDIGIVLNHLHPQRQTIMLSATLTPAVRKVASFALRKGACIVDVVKDSIVSLGKGLSSSLSGKDEEKENDKNNNNNDDDNEDSPSVAAEKQKVKNALKQFDEDDTELLIKRQQKLVGEFVNAQGQVVDIDHSEIVDKLGTNQLVYARNRPGTELVDGNSEDVYEIYEELCPITNKMIKKRRKRKLLHGEGGEAINKINQQDQAMLKKAGFDIVEPQTSGGDISGKNNTKQGDGLNSTTNKTQINDNKFEDSESKTKTTIDQDDDGDMTNKKHHHSTSLNEQDIEVDANGNIINKNNTTKTQQDQQGDNNNESYDPNGINNNLDNSNNNYNKSNINGSDENKNLNSQDENIKTKQQNKNNKNDGDDDNNNNDDEGKQSGEHSIDNIVKEARRQLDSVDVGTVSTYLKQNEEIADELAIYSDNEDELVLFDEVNTNVQHYVQSANVGESLLVIARLFDDIGGRFLYAKQQVEEHNLRVQNDPTYGNQAELEPPKPPKIMVFCETARYAQFLATLFRRVIELDKTNAFEAVLELHSKKGQNYRTRIAQSFSNDNWNAGAILFSSDVAARGLDTKDVDLVVQLGLPPSRQQWIHRVGRVARDGDQQGISLTLVNPEHIGKFAQMSSGLPINTPSVGALGLGVKQDKFNNSVVNPDERIGLSYKPVPATEFGELGEFDEEAGENISGKLRLNAKQTQDKQLLLENRTEQLLLGGETLDGIEEIPEEKRIVPKQDGSFIANDLRKQQKAKARMMGLEVSETEEEEEEHQHDDDSQNDEFSEDMNTATVGDGEEQQTLWHATIERAIAGIYIDRLEDESDRNKRYQALNETTMSANTAQVGTQLNARFDFILRKELARVRKDEEMLLNAERAYISYLGHHMALYQRSKGIQEKLKSVKLSDSPFKNKYEVTRLALEFAKGVGLCGARNDLPPPAISPKNAQRLGFDDKKQHPYLNIGTPTQFSHIQKLQEKEEEKRQIEQQRQDHRERRKYWEAKQRALAQGRPIPPKPKTIIEQEQRRAKEKELRTQQIQEERAKLKEMTTDTIIQKHGQAPRRGGGMLVDFSDDEYVPVPVNSATKKAEKFMPKRSDFTTEQKEDEKPDSMDPTDPYSKAHPYNNPKSPFYKQHQQFLREQEFKKEQAAIHKMQEDKRKAEEAEKADQYYESMQKKRNKKEPAPGRDMLKKTSLYSKEPRRLRTGELDHKVHADMIL